MPSVPLDFIPPAEDNVASLLIQEGPSSTGPFVQIEEVVSIGSSPDYISHYTTNMASSAVDWFRIAWKDDKGAVGPWSVAVQGGTSTLFQKILTNVMQRSPNIDEKVAAQETEFVISEVLGTQNPYDPSLTATIQQITGMTYMVLARTQLVTLIVSSVEDVSSVTLGLVAMKKGSGTTTTTKMSDIEALLELANETLGISTSFVMQMDDLCYRYGIASWDQSRLIGWVGLQ